MIKHVFGIVLTIAFVLLCTFLPFLPGSYDNLAVAVSEMAHLFGTLGLLLAPIGLLWLAADRSSRLVQRRHVFPLLALVTPSQLALERTRGHYAQHDLPQPHWESFLFD